MGYEVERTGDTHRIMWRAHSDMSRLRDAVQEYDGRVWTLLWEHDGAYWELRPETLQKAHLPERWPDAVTMGVRGERIPEQIADLYRKTAHEPSDDAAEALARISTQTLMNAR